MLAQNFKPSKMFMFIVVFVVCVCTKDTSAEIIEGFCRHHY